MYDEAWYNSFVPKASAAQSVRLDVLLKEPKTAEKVDSGAIELVPSVAQALLEQDDSLNASVARRAKSYTDFYYAATAHLKRGHAPDRVRRRSASQLEASQDEERTLLAQAGRDQHVSEALLDASHNKYRLYRDQLSVTRRHLDSLLQDTNVDIDLLSAISSSFQTVDAQTSVFQSRSEGLQAEHSRLSSLAEDVDSNLQYYNYLEPITRRLNAPGAGNFVRGDDFRNMLSNLDNCLDYMQNHPQQREAASYRSKYRLLLTRALTLIRVHFTNTLREVAAEVSKRIADRQFNDSTMSTLLYAKFRVGAPELKLLGLEIKKRAVPPEGAEPGTQAEYQSLMNELHQSYSAARGRLILPMITKKIRELAAAANASKDLVIFARSSISYIRGLCLDEYDLWHEWLDGDDGLYEFLESMCEPLFDHLRPRTIHETQLQKLCEVCSLLQSRYMEDSDEDSESEDARQLDFGYLIRPALEDAQTRLVFQALAVLRDGIERYKPKPEDLDYPTRNRRASLSGSKGKIPVLSGRKNSLNGPPAAIPQKSNVTDETSNDPIELKWGFDAQATSQSWYPTLRKAIWLLGRIYRLVNSTVFDDLAHQIVHQTTLSLYQPAAQITTMATPADGQLFLLQHLLILKQQIVAFDIEFVTPEVSFDFSNVTNTFWELRERGRLFNPLNLMRALSGGGLMPRVVENMLDAKAELDGRLRTVINDFTTDFARQMTYAVSEEATSKKGANGGSAVKATRNSMEKDIEVLRLKLDGYLDDSRTKETLIGAIQLQALHNYEAFFERYVSQAQTNGGAVAKHGKGREDDVWDPDAFADWMESVFGVKRVDMDQEGGAESPGSMSASGSM